MEWYQGRQVSFITPKTYEYLLSLEKKVLIVLTTTRTLEQYQRIDLEISRLPYALICNGGVLLVDGKEDEAWYRQSQLLIEESMEILEWARVLLEKEKRRCFELRLIRKLFLFTKCNEPASVAEDLKKQLDLQQVDVFLNGIKVYVVPKKLHKGMAVRRFRKYISPDFVFAVGDSLFDVPMLEEADCGLAPEKLRKALSSSDKIIYFPENRVFSEEWMAYLLAE
ncbi:MAG: HAD hydrolase family protein [Lachnospiraceae bacterium]